MVHIILLSLLWLWFGLLFVGAPGWLCGHVRPSHGDAWMYYLSQGTLTVGLAGRLVDLLGGPPLWSGSADGIMLPVMTHDFAPAALSQHRSAYHASG
jgi:hypothetical protein